MRAFSLPVVLLFISLPLAAQEDETGNVRDGFWIGFGLGVASLGAECTSCDDSRASGLSGYVRLGGTVSQSVLLGGETNGWLNSDTNVDESLGFASFILMWYPSRDGDLFLKFGAGGMTYTGVTGILELTATAPTASLGLGYEGRVGDNLSVVPFVNIYGSSAVSLKVNGITVPTGEKIKINVAQLGVGLTFH